MSEEQSDRNRAFIATARTALPEALDEIERLRAFIAESRREHSQRDLRRCNKLVNVAYACTCGADDWNARVDAILGGK